MRDSEAKLRALFEILPSESLFWITPAEFNSRTRPWRGSWAFLRISCRSAP